MWARRLAAPAALLGLPLVIASLLRSPAAQQAQESQAPPRLPIVINTWAGCFSEATAAAYQELEAGGSALDAVEQVRLRA